MRSLPLVLASFLLGLLTLGIAVPSSPANARPKPAQAAAVARKAAVVRMQSHSRPPPVMAARKAPPSRSTRQPVVVRTKARRPTTRFTGKPTTNPVIKQVFTPRKGVNTRKVVNTPPVVIPPKVVSPTSPGTPPKVTGGPLTPRHSLVGINPQPPIKTLKPVAAPGRFPLIRLVGGAFPIIAGPKRIFRDGRWHAFVPFTALGLVALGGAYYYPSAYVSVGHRYCTGLSPEGCHLNWQLVGFDGGGSAYQCVQFCPRPGQPPPPNPKLVTLAPPPAAPGSCDLTIFAEPGFGGASSESTTDQPSLAESGWKNGVASMQIKAGVWDFFEEDAFNGESLRLSPGQHPQLDPTWTKHIGSFQCIRGT